MLLPTIPFLSVAISAYMLTGHSAYASNARPQPRVGHIFVIALENHNLIQPYPNRTPHQILGNPAAPFINSLITPGHPNAEQVSYALAYNNSGVGVHPSEPNYVWAEAGSDFGFHYDSDPAATNGNTFYDNSPRLISQVNDNGDTLVFWHRTVSPHLTGQLNSAGIPWRNYQEDVELSASPINSASGTNGPVNPYNGSTQFGYAVKHNPMAFFADSALQNVYPLAQLFLDLKSNAVGRYNWITPDLYNDGHSALTGGFAYLGTTYTGDQSSLAAADNFLSIVIPRIMASKAYQENGAIILWYDETEGGDDTNYVLPEIVISPLAKGNAYASTIPMNHSSDLKTMEEIFNLPSVNNPIPDSETNVTGVFSSVATVNDLSDLFVPGAIPAPLNLSVARHNLGANPRTHHVLETVRITNEGATPAPIPLFLVLDNLGTNATLLNSEGVTALLPPLGSPYVRVYVNDGERLLRPRQTATTILEFLAPEGEPIEYESRVLTVTPAP